MRKLICTVLAFVLCASLAMPAFATFTPSVTVKETPVVSGVVDKGGNEVKNEEGQKAVAVLVTPVEEGSNKKEETHVFEGALVITSISDVKNDKKDEKEEKKDDKNDKKDNKDDKKDNKDEKKDEKLTKQEKEIQKELEKVYDDLEKGKMEIPYEDLGVQAENVVIRELFSLDWHPDEKHSKDGEHFEEVLKQEGATLNITLDLGIAKDEKVYIMVYAKDETGKKVWKKVKAVNNGDGTVTVEFDTLGIVAVCVEQPLEEEDK